METKSQDRLVDELRQLCAQYLAEVPSRRRTWPKSIKERVLQLRQLELSCEEVSRLTGIPAPTLYCWKMPASKTFLPIEVVEKAVQAPSSTAAAAPTSKVATGPRRRSRSKPAPTIIVITPNGVRFEGLDLKSAIAIARELGSWT